MKRILLSLIMLAPVFGFCRETLFSMEEILDAGTLETQVIQDWHLVTGPVDTRQKYVTIRVGELWQGQDLRIPVRMIVPADRKAKGFHLTGGNRMDGIRKDVQVRGTDQLLIEGGVGLVQTLVQNLNLIDQAELGKAMEERFIHTLNPHYSIQYWGWPAIIMRSITAAFSETDHFSNGKVAVSGGSKNGASPSVAMISDKRITALHASVSPPWESPLRLCDRAAWDALNAFNRMDGVTKPHVFLGGTFGPVYNDRAIRAGHSWEDLQQLAIAMSDYIFVSNNLEKLKARGADFLFHPGTHDFVAYDLSWGGKYHPNIPVYLKANSGHGKNKSLHPMAETDEQNKTAFLLNHFFEGVNDLLPSPKVTFSITGNSLNVTVVFPENTAAESGRIWWMFNRAPDGSEAYLRELIPDSHWGDMKKRKSGSVWTVEIPLNSDATTIDIFSNHRKTIRYKGRSYSTYISSPYKRIDISN